MESISLSGQNPAKEPVQELARSAASVRPRQAAAEGGNGSSPAAADPSRPQAAQALQVAQTLAVRYDLKVEVVKDDETGQDVLRVMSPDGKRLLRQFPPEGVLALAERLRRGATEGLLTSLA